MRIQIFLIAIFPEAYGSVDTCQARLEACEAMTELPWIVSGCPPDRFVVPGFGMVAIDSSDPSAAFGGFARVIPTRDSRLIVKMPHQDSIESCLFEYQKDICREKVMLEYMNSFPQLLSVVPRIFVPVVNTACERFIMVSGNAGPFSLKDLITSDESIIARSPLAIDIGIRILEMLQVLHSTGAYHGDIHGGNILFSDPLDIVGSLRFVDFGLSGLITSKNGMYHPETWLDARKAVLEIRVLLTSSRIVMEEISELDAMIKVSTRHALGSITSSPPYEAWIDQLRAIRDRPRLREIFPRFPAYDEGIRWDAVPKVSAILNREWTVEEYLAFLVESRKVSRGICLSSLEDVKVKDLPVELVETLEQYAFVRSGDRLMRIRFIPAPNWLMEKRTLDIEIELELPVLRITDWGNVPNACRPFMFVYREVQFRNSMKIGDFARSAIGLLQSVHDAGIVIGRRFEVKEWHGQLVLEKLGAAEMFVDANRMYLSPYRNCRKSPTSAEILSPGDVMGFCSTRIDDLYRLSEDVIRRLMGPAPHPVFSASMETQLGFQRSLAFLPGVPNILTEFHLEMFSLSLSRTLDRPNYSYWIDRFADL